VEVLREKKKMTLTVKVAERPSDADALTMSPEGTHAWRGVQVGELTEALRQQQNLPPQIHGVVVLRLEPSSPGAMARLRPGDVINGINQQSVRNLADFERATRGVAGDCLVRTLRGYVVVKSSAE